MKTLKYYHHGGVRKGMDGSLTLYGTIKGVDDELVKHTFIGYRISDAIKEFDLILKNKAKEMSQFVSQ